MHLLLTDRLTCPRCGPAFGLILFADRLDERRVLEGSLGCPNCRDRYLVRGGVGDLRPPPRTELPPPPAGNEELEADPEQAAAIAAAMGLGAGGGNALLLEGAASLARPLARTLGEMEFVVADPIARAWGEERGVSRLVSGPSLPFFDGTVRGVVVAGHALGEDLAREVVRVLAPRHRLVVLDPDEAVAPLVQRIGLPELVEGPGLLVAGR